MNDMTRYMMPARSHGKLYAQRAAAAAAAYLERDTHRWVFVRNLIPEVECDVRKWLLQRLSGLYCDLQLMYTPHVHSIVPARTHIVLNNTPPLPSMSRNDEAVEVNARGLNALGTVKALIKATGLNPHLSVYGWPFCLDDVDAAEGGAA